MQVTGLSLDKFTEIVERVSQDNYKGNLKVNNDAAAMSDNRFRARVVCVSSRDAGARRSWTGRRMPSACWHAYRDVLFEVFRLYPTATVRTAMAVYKGINGFGENYPATAYQNIGSMMQPAYMPELCDCHG